MNLPFDEWIVQQRWYAGRNRELTSAQPAVVVSLRDDLDLVLLDVSYTVGAQERYQVIVRWDSGPIEEYADIASIGTEGERTAYDALYNPADAKYLLALVNSSATVGGVSFVKEPDVALPVDTAETLGPVGLTTRAGTSLSPAAQILIQSIRDVAAAG